MNEKAPNIPDYDLIRPIGEGGFGRVWLARNRTTGHLRAVKLVALGRSGTVDGMELADDVSGATATDNDEYLPGSLDNRLADGPLSVEECSRHAAGLLAGLASLHESGMVHRDVKPSNCLFVGGELKLADFGLVTNVGPQISRLGTQKYMPPDGRMDPRADVYAAGLVIHEMITGLPAESFPRLGERAGQIAQDGSLCRLVRLTLGACQPDPEQRFADARAMLGELSSEPHKGATFGPRKIATVLGVMVVAALIVADIVAVSWQTVPVTPPRVHVNFLTDAPLFGATIHLDGKPLLDAAGRPLTIPCTVEDLAAEVHDVVLKHDSLPDQDLGPIDFAKTREVVARWEAGE